MHTDARPGLPMSLLVPARAAWKATAMESLLRSAQLMLTPARGNSWRLTAELEDVWQQIVGYGGE